MKATRGACIYCCFHLAAVNERSLLKASSRRETFRKLNVYLGSEAKTCQHTIFGTALRTRRDERRGEERILSTHSTIFCRDAEAFKRPQLGMFADAFDLLIQDGNLATFRQHGRDRTPERPPRRRQFGERSIVVLLVAVAVADEGILALGGGRCPAAGVEARAKSPKGGEMPRGQEREPVRVEAERARFRRVQGKVTFARVIMQRSRSVVGPSIFAPREEKKRVPDHVW